MNAETPKKLLLNTCEEHKSLIESNKALNKKIDSIKICIDTIAKQTAPQRDIFKIFQLIYRHKIITAVLSFIGMLLIRTVFVLSTHYYDIGIQYLKETKIFRDTVVTFIGNQNQFNTKQNIWNEAQDSILNNHINKKIKK
jgi:hypothetical protein